jgi:hypothetical protein
MGSKADRQETWSRRWTTSLTGRLPPDRASMSKSGSRHRNGIFCPDSTVNMQDNVESDRGRAAREIGQPLGIQLVTWDCGPQRPPASLAGGGTIAPVSAGAPPADLTLQAAPCPSLPRLAGSNRDIREGAIDVPVGRSSSRGGQGRGNVPATDLRAGAHIKKAQFSSGTIPRDPLHD